MCETELMNHPPFSPFPGGLFPLGRIEATPGIRAVLSPKEIWDLLGRHLRGEWDEETGRDGDPSEQDENHAALEAGHQILSGFVVREHSVFVYTTGQRTLTRVMLRSEY